MKNSIPRLAPVSLSWLLLLLSACPLPAQESKGREKIGSVIKAIMDAKRGKEETATLAPGPVDLNAFRAALATYYQELSTLSVLAQRSGAPEFRALSPQIGQIQERAKGSVAYLARENRQERFVEHCTVVERDWRTISNQALQSRGLEIQGRNSVAKLDACVNEMWRCLGRAPQVPILPPGTYPTPGVGREADILLDLLNGEIETLYDKISLRQLLALAPQQTQRLFDQAVRLSDACAALDREISRNSSSKVLTGVHRGLQQEWTALGAVIRAERALRLEASCERVDSYVAELGDLFAGTGRFGNRPGSWPPNVPFNPGFPAFSQLTNLSTRLEVQAGDLVEALRRDGENVRNDSLRSSLISQGAGFLTHAQNFRRFLMRPSVDRSGQVDAALLRQAWQPAAVSWQQVSATLDQLAKQVRRSDRYFPEVFRSQDEIAESVAQIQASVK